MDQLALKAYAKINLSLKVLDKRPDGFHDIDSIMQSVSLHDVVTLKKIHKGIKIKCAAEDVPCDKTNTVYRAAEEMLGLGIKSGVEINIEKNIPVGAGLAGGSADAAAVIEGINILFSLNLPREQLMKIGEKVGSDVPFCLLGGRAKSSGRGEKIEPHEQQSNQWVVLVNPGYEVSTKWAYEEVDRVGKGNEQNDFEVVVAKKHPEVLQIKQQLINLGAVAAQMSGSGPTMFGLFDNKEQAEKALEELINIYLRTYLATFANRGIEVI